MQYLNIYLTNLGKYNEGELVGEWLNLPLSEEEIEEAMKRIGIGDADDFGQPYEEFFITDYDSYIGDHDYGEYADIYEINEMIQEISDYITTEDELELFRTLRNENLSYDEALNIIREKRYVIYSNCKSMEDVAREIVDNTGLLIGAPEVAIRYFDYASYGYDLKKEGYFREIKCDTYLQILY